ncbi:hypothetical protein [Nocardiopsis chromatogenes]|uniref:hypothetical protein n=1 Tax=Nocardiopsis chromatogenes TaxID=280239 RepID=UPI0003704E2E|nr:hypothetical protein [Nocardiopsis chromatogenes]
MGVEKLSVSLDKEVYDKVREAAAQCGLPLSTWLGRAAERAAELQRAESALHKQFSDHGEPSAEDRAWARDQLDAAGVGHAEPADSVSARREALQRLDRLALEDDT